MSIFPHLPPELVQPEVMFLPLAVDRDADWQGLDPAVHSRRLPDFVHQVLNQGRPGPTALLELQTPSEEGPVRWVAMEGVPSHEEAFELLPGGLNVRAVVAGELAPLPGGLRIEFHVFRDDGEQGGSAVSARVAANLSWSDPVSDLLRLTRHLARLLGLRYQEPPAGLMTRNGDAFRHFLQALDNAMLLSGDLEIEMPADGEALMRPFADALALDPRFGLALRVANSTALWALVDKRLDRDGMRRFLDRCYQASPADGDACVAIASQLSGMGDYQRALAWLQHAAGLDSPPARGLESLGMLLVKHGEPARAREYWQRGLELDGHPDFYSHLAQLEFAEGRDDAAWLLLRRGLQHLYERTTRAGEWNDDGELSTLLAVLAKVLQQRQPPAELVPQLSLLCGELMFDDQAYLGLCLLAVGERKAARKELRASLRLDLLDFEVRDRVVRALLQIDVGDFEARFATAVEQVQRGRNLRGCMAQFRHWARLQRFFWPALYFAAEAARKLGDSDMALDLFASTVDIMPGQVDSLQAMAELFAARSNCKRAIELIDLALGERPQDARLHVMRARYLRGLNRRQEALQYLEKVQQRGIESPELRRMLRALRR